MPLNLRFHEFELAVCRLDEGTPVPAGIAEAPFAAVIHVPGETTVICPASVVPAGARVERGWNALELIGPFDFSLTGILAQVILPLGEAGIPVFALSTFDTDYILIKGQHRTSAKAALAEAGHTFRE